MGVGEGKAERGIELRVRALGKLETSQRGRQGLGILQVPQGRAGRPPVLQLREVISVITPLESNYSLGNRGHREVAGPLGVPEPPVLLAAAPDQPAVPTGPGGQGGGWVYGGLLGPLNTPSTWMHQPPAESAQRRALWPCIGAAIQRGLDPCPCPSAHRPAPRQGPCCHGCAQQTHPAGLGPSCRPGLDPQDAQAARTDVPSHSGHLAPTRDAAGVPRACPSPCTGSSVPPAWVPVLPSPHGASCRAKQAHQRWD